MEWWREANHPLVKVVAGFSVPLFLALNFPTAFLAILAGVLLYAATFLGVVHTYRRGYRIVGGPDLALQLAAKTFSKFKEYCNRKVARGWERHQSRKTLQRQRQCNLPAQETKARLQPEELPIARYSEFRAPARGW